MIFDTSKELSFIISQSNQVSQANQDSDNTKWERIMRRNFTLNDKTQFECLSTIKLSVQFTKLNQREFFHVIKETTNTKIKAILQKSSLTAPALAVAGLTVSTNTFHAYPCSCTTYPAISPTSWTRRRFTASHATTRCMVS